MQNHPGIEVTVDTGIDVEAYKTSAGAFSVKRVHTDADVIIIQRPLDRWFCSLIEQAHAQGIKVIVEFDDDFANVHPRNAVWGNVQPELQPDSNYQWLHRACELADAVTVSTRELIPAGMESKTWVIPNFIPERDIIDKVPDKPGPKRIGWSGTLATHPTDLEQAKPGVNQALRDTGASFSVVGDGTGVDRALGLARSVKMGATGWVPVEAYMATLDICIDVGIVPLDDSPFNRAKSYLKGLEYAARGIPFVASPLPEYEELADDGIGRIARTPGDWRRHLVELVSNDDLRLEEAQSALETVKAFYTLETHTLIWAEAWRSVKNS